MALVLSCAFLYGFHVTYFASELCYRCSSKISNFFSLGVPRASKSPAVTTYAMCTPSHDMCTECQLSTFDTRTSL